MWITKGAEHSQGFFFWFWRISFARVVKIKDHVGKGMRVSIVLVAPWCIVDIDEVREPRTNTSETI